MKRRMLMTWKIFFAAALVLGALTFVPRAAFAAEPDTHAAPLAALRATRDTIQRPAALPTALPFQEMFALILKYQRKHASHFSPELIACLFWEESAFRMVKHPVSGAAGFGQVLPATLRAVNERFGVNFTPDDLITSREASVEAAVLALELAWEWKHDKVEALAAYAGGAPNQRIVRKWLNAEAVMLQGRVPYANSFGLQAYVKYHQVRALRLCSQPGFDPQAAFD